LPTPTSSAGSPAASAFAFFPSSTLGEGWAPVGNPFSGEFLYQTPPPPGDIPTDGLPPNATYLIGTLTYDLAKFGIQPGPALFISIAGPDTVIGVPRGCQIRGPRQCDAIGE
jgi:hypothetical protein